MIGQYKLFRSLRGATSFAAVTVESTPEGLSVQRTIKKSALQISWDAGLAQLQRIHGSAVQQGVEIAFGEYQKRGGKPQAVRVTALVESAVDTSPDAVRCAAAIAAWKSWGQPEDQATITNDQGEWIVRFGSQKNST